MRSGEKNSIAQIIGNELLVLDRWRVKEFFVLPFKNRGWYRNNMGGTQAAPETLDLRFLVIQSPLLYLHWNTRLSVGIQNEINIVI